MRKLQGVPYSEIAGVFKLANLIYNLSFKIDEDVRMISSEAPLLFAKAAQIFITEVNEIFYAA